MKTVGTMLAGWLMVMSVSAHALEGVPREQASVLGTWSLESFVMGNPGEEALPFCEGASGTLFYLESGQMSVSINCEEPLRPGAPAEAYGGMLFYSGDFEIRDRLVIHHISHSSSRALVGRSVNRLIETVTPDTLVLTGEPGPVGSALRVVWKRSAPARTR